MDGGAALRIKAYGHVEFGKLASHNFGTNIAGTLRNHTQDDIVVSVNGLYSCAEKHNEGGYSVEGNVCDAICQSAKNNCKCPLGQRFHAVKCSCQSSA
jgi:hypothetical protein